MVRKPGTPEDEAQNQEELARLEASVQQARPSIHTKMVAVMGSLEGMKPEGSNRHFSYDYWTADQIASKFRGLFVKLGLSFMADVIDYDIREGRTSKGGQTWLTTMRVLFTVTDTVSGETVSGHGLGQGDDPGDKGSNKAFAGALKYWLLKTFILGGEDAEADEHVDRRALDEVTVSTRPRVVVEDSDIEGIGRGGMSTQATDVQVKRVRTLATQLEYGVGRMAELIGDVLQREFTLPDEQEDAGPALVTFLGRLPADDIGRLIQYMEKMLPDDRE